MASILTLKLKAVTFSARADWQARKGSFILWCKSDPAYVTMMEAANKNNKKQI